MAIVRRNLTVNFQKSVKITSTDVVVQTVEVAVIPLQDASNAAAIATYVGGIQTLTVNLLNEVNPATFSLIPSNSPGLTNPVNYRIMWRVGGVAGRTETYDFAMPDVDCNFEDLVSIGNIIDGTAYLQQSDLGVAGRVAKLNNNGQVVDAFGIPVVGTPIVTALENALTAEINNRIAQDQLQRREFQADLESQINTSITASSTQLNLAVANWNTSLSDERTQRISAVGTLTSNLTALQTTVTNNQSSVNSSLSTINANLAKKADLNESGLIPLSQIPPEAITNWIPLNSASDRFNLQYPSQIQLGDIVLTPTGLYGLIDTNPAQSSSWYLLNQIQSVNGMTGAIVLDAADVGAIASDASIPQSQISGLAATLADLTPASITDLLQEQVNTIQNDTNIVRLNSNGYVSSSLLDNNVAYVNSINQVVKKDGTVIGTGGGSGGGSVFSVNGQVGVVTLNAAQVGAISTGASIPQTQITGLSTSLAAKADLVSGTVPLAQIPSIPQTQITGLSTALAAKADLSSGTVPLAQIPTLPTSKVTNLQTIISGNGLGTNTNAISRIAALETLVASGGGGGGGGGGTSSSTTVFWNSFNLTEDVTDFSSVTLASPFGIYSSGPNVGQWYYNRNGVTAEDVAFPIVTPGGHLKLYKWNESNPPDPVYALASDLNSLSSNLSLLATNVSSKANQSDLTTLTGRVAAVETGKASKVNGTVPLSELPNIPQSQITNLSTSLAAKADLVSNVVPLVQIPTNIPQSSIVNLATSLAAKADLTNGVLSASQIPTGIPQASIANLSTTLAAKADLSSGTVPLTQLPTIPQTQISNLSTTFAGKADLSSGVVPLTQIPTNIPQSSIANLSTTLSGKANIDSATGTLQASQIPFIAVQRPQSVTNRAAMLALTTSQVHIGDMCLITSTSDQGAYTLYGSDPSVFSNWRRHPSQAGTVFGVAGTGANGRPSTISPDATTGLLSLQPSDIGAMAINASIPQSQITDLANTLSGYATTTALTSGLNGKVGLTEVFNAIDTSKLVRLRVDYAVRAFVDKNNVTYNSAGIASPPSGTPIIDKNAAGDAFVAPDGALVLLTNQASSRENGIWRVNASGNWTRPTEDYATNSTIMPNTIVAVNVSPTASSIPNAAPPRVPVGQAGSSNYTLWQNVSTVRAVVDSPTLTTSWHNIGSVAPQAVVTNGNGGISVGGVYPNITVSAVSGPGIQVLSNGIQIDTSNVGGVVRKFNTTVTPSSATIDITHNLATDYPQVTVIENSSNNVVLLGWSVIKVGSSPSNTVRLEFNSATFGNTYRVSVQG